MTLNPAYPNPVRGIERHQKQRRERNTNKHNTMKNRSNVTRLHRAAMRNNCEAGTFARRLLREGKHHPDFTECSPQMAFVARLDRIGAFHGPKKKLP